MAQIATNTRVDREQLLDFARTRHQLTLVTTRADGRIATGGFPPDRAPSA